MLGLCKSPSLRPGVEALGLHVLPHLQEQGGDAGGSQVGGGLRVGPTEDLPEAGTGPGQEASSHVGTPPAADRCLLGFPPTEHLDPFKAAWGDALGPSLQILDTCQGPLAAAN